MTAYRPLLFVLLLLLVNACWLEAFCQDETAVKQIELNNSIQKVNILIGKVVKIDVKSADTTIQIKGRIMKITDSYMVINGMEIDINAINAIYVNHLILGNYLLTIGSILVVFDVFEISIITRYGNIVPPLLLLPVIVGVPMVVVGFVSLLHWRKFDVEKEWKMGISNIPMKSKTR